MAKAKKAVESAEVKEEQVVSETTKETVETPVEETNTEESESKDETDSESKSVEDTEDVNEKSEETDTETVEEKPEENVTINDGAEGDAGQASLNDIPVDFEDISKETKNEDEYVNAHIKLENILVDLKDIRDKDISFSKNEDLEVTIVYVEHAIDSILKLRK